MAKIIGVCGGTASGKTTLTQKLVKALGNNVSVVALDNYYKNFGGILEELSKVNYDHPNSLDLTLFTDHITSLRENCPVEIPIYDYATHSRTKETFQINSTDVIIVEGLFLYNIGVPIELYDLKIFMDTPSDIRFVRRLIRDREERGRDVESIINQYLATVRPMHDIYVTPNKELADVVFHGENYSNEELNLLLTQIKKI